MSLLYIKLPRKWQSSCLEEQSLLCVISVEKNRGGGKTSLCNHVLRNTLSLSKHQNGNISSDMKIIRNKK